jgi:hypothetical protein
MAGQAAGRKASEPSGTAPRDHQPTKELGEPCEVRIGQPIVQSAKVLETGLGRHAGGAPPARPAPAGCARPQSRDASSDAWAASAGVHRRAALRHPHGEDERQPRPLLPLRAEVVHGAGTAWAMALPSMRRRSAAARHRRSRGVPHAARPQTDRYRATSASPGTNSGRTFHTCSNSSSSSVHAGQAAAAHEHALAAEFTRRTRLKSITLRTGPSHEMASSGSSRYRWASRAYSTAETTLTSSSPLGHRGSVPWARHPRARRRAARAPVDGAVDGVAVDVRDATDAHQARRPSGRREFGRRSGRRRRSMSIEVAHDLIERIALGRHLPGPANERSRSGATSPAAWSRPTAW